MNKLCPFCEAETLTDSYGTIGCIKCGTQKSTADEWNNRPIEDKLKMEVLLYKSMLKSDKNYSIETYKTQREFKDEQN